MPRESSKRARVRRALAKAQREHRKLFVHVHGDRFPEDRRYAGTLYDEPFFDEPPYVPKDWASRAQVGDRYYVSGHTCIERIW